MLYEVYRPLERDKTVKGNNGSLKRVKLFGHKYIVTERAENIWEISELVGSVIIGTVVFYMLYFALWIFMS